MASTTLAHIQTEMNFYGYLILLVFGDIGNIFNLILFYRQRQNPCSVYLMASFIANILYLTVGGLLKIFSSSYSDGNLQALLLCKTSNYIPGLFGQVTKTLLIFACIDRYMITSRNHRLRAFSTAKRAKYIVCGTFIVWAIVPIHTLINLTIVNGQCNRVGWYLTFSAFYAVLLIGFIPALLLCVFSYLTWRNMKQLRNRIRPIERDMTSNSDAIRPLKRRDRQLLVLVLAEAIIYIITTSPFTIVSLESMITSFLLRTKTLPLVQVEVFATNVATLFIFVFSAAPFYTYMIVSTSFRRDFQKLVFNGCHEIIRRLTFN